jgi:hypothetical protein
VSKQPSPEIEEPKGPVEIFPPDAEDESPSRIWIASGSRRIKVVKLGPVTGALAALAVIAILLSGFAFMTGALLILIPVGALLAAGAWLSGLLGNPFKRLR